MVFSESFVNDLKTLNDKKTKIDHETGNTHKHYWIHATLAYNNQQEDDVVLTINEVVNDTFDMAAAVATEFDTDATDDESSKVGMFQQLWNRIQPIKRTEMNSHQLLFLPMIHTLQIWRRMMRLIWNNLK